MLCGAIPFKGWVEYAQRNTCSRALSGLPCAGAVKSTPCYGFLTYWSDGPLLCLSVSIHSLTTSRIDPSVYLTSFFFLMLIPINLSNPFFIDPLSCGTLCLTQYNLWQVKENFVLPSKKNGEIKSLIPSQIYLSQHLNKSHTSLSSFLFFFSFLFLLFAEHRPVNDYFPFGYSRRLLD